MIISMILVNARETYVPHWRDCLYHRYQNLSLLELLHIHQCQYSCKNELRTLIFVVKLVYTNILAFLIGKSTCNSLAKSDPVDCICPLPKKTNKQFKSVINRKKFFHFPTLKTNFFFYLYNKISSTKIGNGSRQTSSPPNKTKK